MKVIYVLPSGEKMSLEEFIKTYTRSDSQNTFPRSTGRAKIFHVPANVVKLEDDIEITSGEIAKTFEYFKKRSDDLVKGDVIIFDCCNKYRTDGHFVYDGKTILPLLYDETDDGVLLPPVGLLPTQFQVLKDGVPVNYWGETFSEYVWFDYRKLEKKIRGNIKYGDLDLVNENGSPEKLATAYVDFVVSGESYKIAVDFDDEDADKATIVQFLKKRMLSSELHPLSMKSTSTNFRAPDGKTLFIYHMEENGGELIIVR